MIEKYDTIIIHRHLRPDFDAIGSQVGLKEAILATYPKKKVYVVGDTNRLDRNKEMDEISDDKYQGALVFIVDVAVKALVSDDRYTLADKIIVIDHHNNPCDIEEAITYIDPTYEAAAALIAEILFDQKFKISPKSADMLMSGIITDSGRFMYLRNGERLFKIAAKLMKLGADPMFLYSWLYTEDLKSRKMKAYLQNIMEIEEGVAYTKITKEVREKFSDVDLFTISRGTVNLMSGIDGILIWLNFTYDTENDVIIGEFRSRGLSIVEIAKAHGGGGHDNACGATLKNWAEVDEVIKEYQTLLKTQGGK